MSPFEAAVCRSAPWRFVARRVVLPWALQGVRPHGRVLEIGAGSGAMAAELLSTFGDISMCVTDVDDGMVTAASDRLRSFADRVELRQADATALPFDDDSFDVVVSWIMLHHAVRWEQALAEVVRVLRPGGRLVAYDLLATGPFRRLHRDDGHHHRAMQLDELQRVLRELLLDDISVRRGRGGIVVRFNARVAGGRGGSLPPPQR